MNVLAQVEPRSATHLYVGQNKVKETGFEQSFSLFGAIDGGAVVIDAQARGQERTKQFGRFYIIIDDQDGDFLAVHRHSSTDGLLGEDVLKQDVKTSSMKQHNIVSKGHSRPLYSSYSGQNRNFRGQEGACPII
jgi:hypothetical protein